MRLQKTTVQFLLFHLTSDLQAMMPTEGLDEVLKCEVSQIIPILEMPKAVMGVYSHRGEVLWVVDLPLLLDLTPLYAHEVRQVYDVLVMHHHQKVAGFAVPTVGQLVNYKAVNMQPPPSNLLSTPLGKCLAGVYRLSQSQDTLVLDPSMLFDRLKVPVAL